jgi:hypothetical protein
LIESISEMVEELKEKTRVVIESTRILDWLWFVRWFSSRVANWTIDYIRDHFSRQNGSKLSECLFETIPIIIPLNPNSSTLEKSRLKRTSIRKEWVLS